MGNQVEKRMLRSEVPTNMTWNLKDLFENRGIWKERVLQNEKDFNALSVYKGALCVPATNLYDCLTRLEKASISMIQLGTYATLLQSEDATNPQSQEDSLFYGAVATRSQSTISFISSEITLLDVTEYKALFVACPSLKVYKNYLDDVYMQKPHKLSPDTEVALASLGEVMSAPYRTYQVSKGADMTFENFTTHSNVSLENSFALFESKYEFSPDTNTRRSAYDSFSKTLFQYKNTYAAIYATEVKKQVALRKLRNYDSVTQMLLEPQKVTLDMYNRQIDIIFEKLAPHMRKFATLKREQLGLDVLHFCDLKAPLDFEFNPPANYESIQKVIIEALGILGDDYASIMKRAFDERWIDYADNIGKSTGAFCASPYDAHPYILISYQESMRSAFTLAHELGHAGHFSLANKAQRVFDTRPSTYFIEAPSTMNEILLANHLMKQDDNPRMKRWVILQLLGTYYHNFVTHLLEAEFQRRVYAHAENGGSLTANVLCAFKNDVLTTFWGDSVVIDDFAGLTWMRQPHYYMGLYPYTYSAGLTAATAMAVNIFEEGQPAIERWLSVLKAGGSLTPDGLLKCAGLDMSTSEPIEAAVEYVGTLIEELVTLFE